MQALAPAHGIAAAYDDFVGLVGNAVADRVGYDGLPELLVPAADVGLGAEYGRAFLVAGLGYLQDIVGFRVF